MLVFVVWCEMVGNLVVGEGVEIVVDVEEECEDCVCFIGGVVVNVYEVGGYLGDCCVVGKVCECVGDDCVV